MYITSKLQQRGSRSEAHVGEREQEIRNGKPGVFRGIMKPKLSKVEARFVVITKCLKPPDVLCDAGMLGNSYISLKASFRTCSLSGNFQAMKSYAILPNGRHATLKIYRMKPKIFFSRGRRAKAIWHRP